MMASRVTYIQCVIISGGEGSVDVLEMALRMASSPQDSGTYCLFCL